MRRRPRRAGLVNAGGRGAAWEGGNRDAGHAERQGQRGERQGQVLVTEGRAGRAARVRARAARAVGR